MLHFDIFPKTSADIEKISLSCLFVLESIEYDHKHSCLPPRITILTQTNINKRCLQKITIITTNSGTKAFFFWRRPLYIYFFLVFWGIVLDYTHKFDFPIQTPWYWSTIIFPPNPSLLLTFATDWYLLGPASRQKTGQLLDNNHKS